MKIKITEAVKYLISQTKYIHVFWYIMVSQTFLTYCIFNQCLQYWSILRILGCCHPVFTGFILCVCVKQDCIQDGMEFCSMRDVGAECLLKFVFPSMLVCAYVNCKTYCPLTCWKDIQGKYHSKIHGELEIFNMTAPVENCKRICTMVAEWWKMCYSHANVKDLY